MLKDHQGQYKSFQPVETIPEPTLARRKSLTEVPHLVQLPTCVIGNQSLIGRGSRTVNCGFLSKRLVNGRRPTESSGSFPSASKTDFRLRSHA